MENLYKQLNKMKGLIISEHGLIKPILTEQDLKDKVLLDNACKKWKTLSLEKKTDWSNTTTNITKEEDPYDMDVACESKNTEEAIQNKDVYRLVLKDLIELK
jgi:hypothetical protein